jgi:hypothetical protein
MKIENLRQLYNQTCSNTIYEYRELGKKKEKKNLDYITKKFVSTIFNLKSVEIKNKKLETKNCFLRFEKTEKSKK